MERSGVTGRVTRTKYSYREMELACGVGDHLWSAPSSLSHLVQSFWRPLTTEGSPWVWVEMDSDKAITGRVIDFGLEDPAAGSLVLVMVTVIVGDTDDKRPRGERWYIPEKSVRSLRVEYVSASPKAIEETGKV